MCLGCQSNTVKSDMQPISPGTISPGTIEVNAIVPTNELKLVGELKGYSNECEFELNGIFYQTGSLLFIKFIGNIIKLENTEIAVGKMFFDINHDRNKEKKSFSILINKLAYGEN